MTGSHRQRVRSLQSVDEMVGHIVGKLQAQGKLADTYIVFTSDNGFHHGEHRYKIDEEDPLRRGAAPAACGARPWHITQHEHGQDRADERLRSYVCRMGRCCCARRRRRSLSRPDSRSYGNRLAERFPY